jgi:hypothetical protein
MRIKERMSGRFGKVIVFLSGFGVGWLDVFLTQRGAEVNAEGAEG